MRLKKTRMSEEAATEGSATIDSTHAPANNAGESLHVFNGRVGQGGRVEVRPELFHRIQFRGVGREPLESEPVARSRIRPQNRAKPSVFERFFYPWPRPAHPSADGPFIAFARPAIRALATPAQLAEHAPHLGNGVTHMAGLGDHLADSLQRPQVGAKAPSRWAFQQSGDQPKPALRTQTRSASGASRSAQSVAPLPLPGTIPAVRGGTADAPAP